MGKIKVTQTKSAIGSTKRQKATLAALGLKKISGSNELENTPQVLGMVRKVNHLVKVEEL